MTLRRGHWQPRDEDSEVKQHLERLLDYFCPKPLMVQLPDGRVMLDEFYLDEMSLDDLTDGLRRAEQRQLMEERPRVWVYTLIELLKEQIALVSAAELPQRTADPGKIEWGPQEPLEVAPSLSSKPPIPQFRGPKGGR